MKLLSTAQCSLSDDVALAYLTDQLIAYIGNKRKLLGLIRQAIQQTGLTGGVFFDMFAGSGSVSRLAKHVGFRVIANDWEPYNTVRLVESGMC
ncbi:MAG: DNA adenine methylase, partial [Armatimonadota bacterium]